MWLIRKLRVRATEFSVAATARMRLLATVPCALAPWHCTGQNGFIAGPKHRPKRYLRIERVQCQVAFLVGTVLVGGTLLAAGEKQGWNTK